MTGLDDQQHCTVLAVRVGATTGFYATAAIYANDRIATLPSPNSKNIPINRIHPRIANILLDCTKCFNAHYLVSRY
jgi:hypothetical protein